MSLFQKIKVLLSLNKIAAKLKEDVKMANHNYLSTEFVGKVIVQLVIIIGTLQGILPAKYAIIAISSLTAIYMVLRTIYKIKNPGQDLPDLPK